MADFDFNEPDILGEDLRMIRGQLRRFVNDAIKRCAKARTWACTITQLEATKDFGAGVVAPASFSANNHRSLHKLQLLKANPKTLPFSPID